MATNFSGKKIPDLLPASDLQDSDLLVVEQPTGTRKTNVGSVKITDASFLTIGTLPDGRLSQAVQTSLGKANTASQPGHTHTASEIVDFSTAVAAASPSATNASLLTSGTLPDARLSQTVQTSLGKADTASQPGHTHAIGDVTGLSTALAGKQATGNYSLVGHTHTASEITDFSSAVVAAAPPTTNASLLTSGTLADARLSQSVQTSLGKADTASQPGHTHAINNVTGLDTALAGKQAAGSYATLVDGLVPSTQLPSYVDDVVEFTNYAALEAQTSPAAGKIYVTLDTNKIYRWTGTTYIEISAASMSINQINSDWDATSGVAQILNKPVIPSLIYASAIPNTTTNAVLYTGMPAEPASAWKTRTLSQALDAILFPTVLPTISIQKGVTLTVSGDSGIIEVGTIHGRILTHAFEQGRITNGDGTQGPLLVGAATTVAYAGGPGITGATSNGSLGDVAVVEGTNNWTVTVTHLAGTGTYFDNKGNSVTNLNTSRASGSVSDVTSSPTITGVYPWYVIRSPVPFTAAQFKTAIQTGSATHINIGATMSKTVGDASGTLSIPYNMTGQYLGVAYEEGLTTKTIYYVAALDTGAITAVFNAVETENNVTTANWSRSYKIHRSTNPITNSNPTLELRNPV